MATQAQRLQQEHWMRLGQVSSARHLLYWQLGRNGDTMPASVRASLAIAIRELDNALRVERMNNEFINLKKRPIWRVK